MKSILPPALVFLFTINSFGQQSNNYVDSIASTVRDIKEELVKIKDNYYVIRPYGLAGNIGVYTGRDQVILIDDQYSILSSRIEEILKTITDKPIKYIVNTHFHFDHSDGNRSFAKGNIQIIAQKNTRERLSKDQVLPPSNIQKAHPSDVLPSITFTDSLQLYDGMETIELIHFMNAHTDGDVIVHFKKADIYHTGDIFITYGLPFIDENNGGDIYGIIEAVDYLLSVSGNETRFIPGHGPLCTIKELSDYRNLITSIKDEVVSRMKKGYSLERIINEVKIDEKISGAKDAYIPHVYKMALKHEKRIKRKNH